MKYQTIVVLGKPGSGKGTQAKLLSEKSGFHIFTASEYLKKLAQSHPVVGEHILNDMEQGILVPHWIMSSLWITELMNLQRGEGIIFDGAVRKAEESEIFHEAMTWLGRPYIIIYLSVSEEELRERLLKRAHTEGRVDDADKTVTRRLEQFKENTEPSLAFFREKGTLLEIDGNRSVEEIHEDIMNQIG